MTIGRQQILVTGGSRGIGKAICLEAAKNGFDVAFTFRTNKEQAELLCKEIENFGVTAKAYALDQAQSDLENSLDQIQTDFPNLDTIVLNAGTNKDGLTLRYSTEQFDELYQTNIRGSFKVAQYFLRPLMKKRKGSIIFMSSVIGQMGNAGQVAYSASKAALIGMTKSLAKEVGSRNIRVNAIAPGFIETDMTSSLPENTKQSILSQIPLGRFGQPQDVAKAVVFLATPASEYITGQVLSINGGLYA
jgi:3-oxoacyl-[acyl-carrier protein] reductase